MHHAADMIRTNPATTVLAPDLLAECIAACAACAQSNVACADACLGEADPSALARCIRLNLDCGDVCTATERVLSRQQQPDVELLRKQLEACLRACVVCAEECEEHQSTHEHCRVCAEACRQTEEVCQRTLQGMPTAPAAQPRH